jgi:hypothetical protein
MSSVKRKIMLTTIEKGYTGIEGNPGIDSIIFFSTFPLHMYSQ